MRLSIARINKKTAIYVAVLAAALFLFHAAENFEFEQVGNRIGPNAWPLMILSLLIVVAGYGVLKSLRPAVVVHEQAAEEEALLRPPEIHPHLVWLGMAATVGYLIVMPILGFFLSTILFSGILIYVSQYRNSVNIAVLSVLFAVAFLFLFMRIVYVALPIGIEPFARVSLMVMSLIGVR
jgi:putative tricarboxylic transport membrane protein